MRTSANTARRPSAQISRLDGGCTQRTLGSKFRWHRCIGRQLREFAGVTFTHGQEHRICTIILNIPFTVVYSLRIMPSSSFDIAYLLRWIRARLARRILSSLRAPWMVAKRARDQGFADAKRGFEHQTRSSRLEYDGNDGDCYP
jgi:hypothetical protein